MNKVTIGVIVSILVAFVAMIVYSSISAQPADYSGYDASRIISDTSKTGGIAEHVRGKADSSVVVVEYADFQCPGCASMMPKITQLTEKYQDKVAFVFRHYPIQGHQNARSASASAEAAGMQGYFWQMAEALYANRADWIYETGESRTDQFVKIFKSVAPDGDENAFRANLGNDSIEKKINFDMKIGKDLSKVQATPSFFVNGEAIPINDDDSLDDYASNIEARIKAELAK